MAKNVPEIRLDGFEGEWDETTLGELGTVIGGGTPKTTVASYWGGDIPWFTPAEIDSSGSGVITKSERSITAKGLAESSAKLLPPNSVLMTTRASIGHVAVNSVPVTTNQGFQSIVPDSENSKWFIYNWVLGHKKELIGEASGSTFLEIGAQAVREFQLFAPSLDEQRAIGNFFADLDSTITESATKIEKLKNLRATMLVKMFPQGSSKVPEIRLGGFEGEWEDVQFSELVDRVSSRADNSFDLPRVEYEDIVSGKGTLRSDFFDKQSSKDGILFEPGDVLYGKLRPYLKNWILADFDGIAVGDFWVLRGIKVTPSFLFQLIQSERFAGLAKMTTGTKMPRADWSVMGSATYEVPTDPEEQRAIGTFFRELDELIDAEELKLTKLTNLKNTFLTKMFV